MDEMIIAILRSSTPLIYVTLAGVLAQRTGIWNLGLEGLMIIGACATVLGIAITGSFLQGFLLAVGLCVAASVLLWFVIERLKANQIIAGLGLTGLGLGGTAFAVEAYMGSQVAVTVSSGAPKAGPVLGAFGVLSIFVLLMPVVVLGLWVLLKCTRFGLQLAACGEHAFAARSVGADPSRLRLIALAAGGVLCAAGGAELATGSLQLFAQNMTAGRGFMAFAAVIFGAGHPVWSTLAALFFAVAGVLGVRVQLTFGDNVPHGLLQTLPYLATILGVWISGKLRGGAKAATLTEEQSHV